MDSIENKETTVTDQQPETASRSARHAAERKKPVKFPVAIIIVIAAAAIAAGVLSATHDLVWFRHGYNTDRDPPKRIAVYINGAGHVELRKGTSDRVSNDFSKSIAGIDWKDYRTQRKMADPKHVQDIFQNLVNAGVLDRDKWGKKSKKKKFDRFIAVKANISNQTYSEPDNIFEVDPDLAELLLDVIREFDDPTL